MAAARRRRRDEDARTRELGETGKETAGERTLAGEAVRLQELLGNVSATEVMARSLLQRDTSGTEAAPAKAGEERKDAVTYAMTVSDIGTFDLLSWSWGGDTGASGGGGGPGKHTVRELSATKRQDKHTPVLRQHADSGQHIASVELRGQRGGESITVKLKDVLVTGYTSGVGEGGADPIETFTLAFAEIEYDYGGKPK